MADLPGRPCAQGRPSATYLWATPRSVSTAFAKALSQIDEVTLLHEPYTFAYYFGPDRVSRRYGHAAGHDDDWAAVVAESLHVAARASERLLVKELAFQGRPFVTPDLLGSGAHTFLIRRPEAVFTSLVALKPDFTEDEFGFLALWSLFARVQVSRSNAPVVVDGDAFRKGPRTVMSAYCDMTGLPFSDSLLHWDDGRIRAWDGDERMSQERWHRTLEASRGVLAAAPPVALDWRQLSPSHRRMLATACEVYEAVTTLGTLCGGPIS